MNPIDILAKYYKPNSKTFDMLVEHGRLISAKALRAAGKVRHLKPDLELIEKAAMLHDIGIFMTDSPGLGCHGSHPYIRHGLFGRYLLGGMGYTDLALICERHVGVGISVADIKSQSLPLPRRNMLPVTIEEQIICYADKFYSKNGKAGVCEKSVAEIMAGLKPYGPDKIERFQEWVDLFAN